MNETKVLENTEKEKKMIPRGTRGHAEFRDKLDVIVWNHIQKISRDITYVYGPVSKRDLISSLINVTRELQEQEREENAIQE